MAQIQKGDTFADGQLVTGVRLNQLVDAAQLNPEAITDQPLITVANLADKLMIFQSESVSLKSITLSSIFEIEFPPITVSQLISTAAGGISITSFHAVQISGKSMTVSIGGTDSGNLTLSCDNTISIGGTQSTSGVSLIAPITASAKLTLNTTDSIKIPVGTTAQRPATPVTGDLRFNTTTGHTEVYNGTAWEAVGGSPFDGTGGNIVIAPDNTSYTATFSSSDGLKVTITKTGHSVNLNESIELSSSITGYSGRFGVKEVTANTFVIYLTAAAIPNSGSCSFVIKRKYKTHFFTSSGTFVPASDGYVDVLVVGGGGGGWDVGAGGGGAVVQVYDYEVTAGTTYYATVGTGGNGGNSNYINPTAGGTSSFGVIVAGGGGIPYGSSGTGFYNGASGTGNYGTISYSGLGISYGGSGAGGQSQNFVSPTGSIYKLRGGNGVFSDFSGIITGYGGGGMNGQYGVTSNPSGYDTSSIYGEGTYPPNQNGRPNTGGGGASYNIYPWTMNGGNGGSGIIIVRYISWL